MKQFKAEWQDESDETHATTIGHIITQHNALCERLGEKQTNSYTCVGEGCFPNNMIPNGGTIKIGTITLPKPEWWDEQDRLGMGTWDVVRQTYLEALTSHSEAIREMFWLGYGVGVDYQTHRDNLDEDDIKTIAATHGVDLSE